MVINGKQIAEKVLESLKRELSLKDLKLRLAAVLVGEDSEFEKFVELKGKAAEEIGVEFPIYQFPAEITTEELSKRVREISELSNGVLVELPLPEHIDQQAVLNEIPVDKDVDVLSTRAQDLFYSDKSKILSPSAEALRILFEELNINPTGKIAAIFGYGLLIGKPVAYWLEQNGAMISVIRSKTENPTEVSRQADIVVTGVGKPRLINGDMIKEGVMIIDYGYGRNSSGNMVGDVDFKSVASKESLITPVPGGMGPILIAAVLKNLVRLNSL